MTIENLKTEIAEKAQDLLDAISELYHNAECPDYNDLLTTETYLNVILHMSEEVH